MPTSPKLYISSLVGQTRVAKTEGDQVVDLEIEYAHERSCVGNLYLGRVVRVMPGMQAAFVDVGLERAGFLYVGDLAGSGPDEEPPPIESILKPGQELLVQVQKAPISTKGPRLTCRLSLPGRYLVLMPGSDHVGVSRRLLGDEERERLRHLVESLRSDQMGYIARTAAEGIDADAIERDMDALGRLWLRVRGEVERGKGPRLIHEDSALCVRALRDMLTADACDIFVDSDADAQRVTHFLEAFDPGQTHRLRMWGRIEPMFQAVGIEQEISRALVRKVWLRSGGSIVIDQAEALTAIDVNTGSYLGKTKPSETILRTNLEAIPEIVQQLRLRNLGGIVIVDFIDMEDEEHRQRVIDAMEEALAGDRSRTQIHSMTELGLMELTRKRVRESLARQLSETCPTCDGRGIIKSRLTVAYEVMGEFAATARHLKPAVLVANVHPEVHDVMVDQFLANITELGQQVNCDLRIHPKGSYHPEQFDVYASDG